MAGFADLEIYKAMGMSLGTFGDWVGSIMVIFMPLVAAIYGIINGTGTLAGEEEDGPSRNGGHVAPAPLAKL
jgi:hypothetical protein